MITIWTHNGSPTACLSGLHSPLKMLLTVCDWPDRWDTCMLFCVFIFNPLMATGRETGIGWKWLAKLIRNQKKKRRRVSGSTLIVSKREEGAAAVVAILMITSSSPEKNDTLSFIFRVSRGHYVLTPSRYATSSTIPRSRENKWINK